MRIYLVRHGLSRANVDWSENRRVADHAIELTEQGKQQAREAGAALAEQLRALTVERGDGRLTIPRIRLWNSPYKRTRQTAAELASTCLLPELPDGAAGYVRPASPAATAEPERTELAAGDSWLLDRKEHFLLHEQQFGIFDGLSDEERLEQYPAETAHYEKCKRFEGKVWAKLPMGESRMDVARRMHQAFGTFHRDAARHAIETIVVVGHGTTNRCFTMAWLHLGFEWLEAEPNPQNCSIRLIEDGQDRGYVFAGYPNPPGYKHAANIESEQ